MYNLISKFTGIKLEKLESINLSALFSRPEAHGFSISQIERLKNLAQLISQYNEVLIVQEKILLDSSIKATNYIESIYKSIMTVETMKAIWLDSRLQVIEVSTISSGTVNESTVYIRNIIKLALNNNATSVILCHNHPAGTLGPSGADLAVTCKVKEALNAVGINLLDHIIAIESGSYSFAQHGTL